MNSGQKRTQLNENTICAPLCLSKRLKKIKRKVTIETVRENLKTKKDLVNEYQCLK